MGNEVLVSVVMPVYNGMPLIKQSVDSLLRQTYKNWECIIINDGSTDETKAYIESLNDSRFRVYSFEKNLGRPYARQKGLDMARGKYLAMLDADDIYHPNKLEKQVDLLEKNITVSLVSSAMCLYGTKTKHVRAIGKGAGEIVKFDAAYNIPVCHASSMLRTEEAKQYKYDVNLKIGEDVDFLKKYLKGKKYIKQRDILYYYSMFDSVDKTKIINTLKIYIHKFKVEGRLKEYIILISKLFIYRFLFLFFSSETILSVKSESMSSHDLLDYNKYCLPYIISISKQK